jgi:hypothetical protein
MARIGTNGANGEGWSVGRGIAGPDRRIKPTWSESAVVMLRDKKPPEAGAGGDPRVVPKHRSPTARVPQRVESRPQRYIRVACSLYRCHRSKLARLL